MPSELPDATSPSAVPVAATGEHPLLGPAGSIEAARRLIAQESFDAVLVDANLAGQPVDELAAALTQKGIPFAVATGYGQQGLPLPFRDAPLLIKPFRQDQLIAVLEDVFGSREPRPTWYRCSSRNRLDIISAMGEPSKGKPERCLLEAAGEPLLVAWIPSSM